MPITRREFVKGALDAAGGGPFLTACAAAEGPAAGQGNWEPAYVKLERKGEFAERVEMARSLYEKCACCPRGCEVNRLKGERGFCRASAKATVHSHNPHFGEELPLVGRRGSGTIFFSHCNLRCVFCQNWPIAHEGRGREVDDERLAGMMLDVQRMGCHNVNVVTPTHVMPNILAATRLAMQKGLRIPLCWNTSGYESPAIVALLDGIVDIYLPDMKCMDAKQARRYMFHLPPDLKEDPYDAPDYPAMAKASILEMNRQVGVLQTDGRGVALSGVMIRHLVMPNRVAGTREFVQWVAENLPKDTYLNIMSQYRVEHRAFEHPPIARAITPQEFLEAMDWAEEAGLTNLDSRSLSQRDVFRRRARWGG